MNKILIGWGVDPKIANTFDGTIIAILMSTTPSRSKRPTFTSKASWLNS